MNKNVRKSTSSLTMRGIQTDGESTLRNKVEDGQGNDTTIRPRPFLLTLYVTMRRRSVSLTTG